ncbi:MAG TPA: DUF1636 family protein [Armatimonadota bacterium]|nr:DUF1636 family protein [Armatimonadota bacterium]
MDLTGYVIAVCRDKDCDREPCGDAKKPGKQFVKTLEDAIEAVAIPHLVRIKTTKCLGYCKHGRAVEVRGAEGTVAFGECNSPAAATEIVRVIHEALHQRKPLEPNGYARELLIENVKARRKSAKKGS